MAEHVIEMKGLWTQFGDHIVHRDIDLGVCRGEIMSLVGGSGSGKTTLLRQMLGLERPARGEVLIFGEALHGSDPGIMRRLRDRRGVLFQEGALFSALTVFDNVALPLRELRTLDQGLIHDLVMMKLRMVGIEPQHADKMPAELSGGMVKRIALARALALEPTLLLLDEPAAGLNPSERAELQELIRRVHAEGLTIALVEHDVRMVTGLCARAIVLDHGEKIADGASAMVVRNPRVQAAYFGEVESEEEAHAA